MISAGPSEATNADNRHPRVTTPTPLLAWAPGVDLRHWEGYACTRRTDVGAGGPTALRSILARASRIMPQTPCLPGGSTDCSTCRRRTGP
jgi:hypothetical protein